MRCLVTINSVWLRDTWCPSTGVLVPAQNGDCLYLGYPICDYVHICSISPCIWSHFQTWAKQEVIGTQSSWLPKNRNRKCVDTDSVPTKGLSTRSANDSVLKFQLELWTWKKKWFVHISAHWISYHAQAPYPGSKCKRCLHFVLILLYNFGYVAVLTCKNIVVGFLSNSCLSISSNPNLIFGSLAKAWECVACCWLTNVLPSSMVITGGIIVNGVTE